MERVKESHRFGALGASTVPRRSYLATIEDPIALLAVLAGLVAAVMLLPADVEARGALRLSSAVVAISLGVFPVLASIRDPRAVLRAEHVLILAPVYWLLLDPLQGGGEFLGLTPHDVERAFTAIAVFVCAAWLAFVQSPWRAPKFVLSTTSDQLPSQFYFGIGTLAFTLAFLKYAIPSNFDFGAMTQALGEGRWSGAWQRGDIGGPGAFLDHLSYFGYLLPPLTVIVVRRVGRGDPRSWILTVFALVLSLFIAQGGGRRLFGVYFGIGAVVWFLGARKVRLSTVVAMGLLIVSMLFMFEQMIAYRDRGLVAMYDQEAQLHEGDSGALVRVDDNFYRLAQITAIFPERHDYTTWRYVLWVAVRPIPRLFWPGKPLDPGFDLPGYVGLRGVSLSSSVVGELFMAGGFLAVALGGWFYGRLARGLSQFLAEANTPGALLIYSVGLFAVLVGVRSMIELVLTSYVVLAWVGLVHLYRGFRIPRFGSQPLA